LLVSRGLLSPSDLPAFLKRLKIRIIRRKVPLAGVKRGEDGISRNAYLGADLKLTFKGWSESEFSQLLALAKPKEPPPRSPGLLFVSPNTSATIRPGLWLWLWIPATTLVALLSLFLVTNRPKASRPDLLRRWQEKRDPDLITALAGLPVQDPADLSLEPPIQALFLCEPYYAVMCADTLLMIGDWVSKDGWTGYISEIAVDGLTAPFLSLKVRNGTSTEVIRWPLTNFKGPNHVYIYSTGKNLVPVIRCLQRLGDFFIRGKLDGGLVTGTFAADSYGDFVQAIAGSCYLSFDGATIFVNPTTSIRSHIRQNRYMRKMTLAETLAWYRELFGTSFIFDDLDDILSSQQKYGLYNYQFEDALMYFGLDHEFDGEVVRISRSLPR